MINRALTLILLFSLTACSHQPTVHAKTSAPVSIESSVPENIQTGEHVSTTIRFVAEIDLQQLVLSADAYSGLTLVSGGDEIVLSDLKYGDSREIKVSILLEDEVGYLAVYAETTDDQGRTQHKNITLRFGTVGADTLQKMKSSDLHEDSAGEKVIILPVEDR